ncbi:hypothetical protein [Nocardia tengchongensis]|uniref:hypothetical protein n=1 Tax=Nocardia tengchongensis TaxID=2055889 RepID=UPI0036B9800B
MNTADDSPPKLPSHEEILRRIQENQDAAAQLFIPSPVIEHLLWQVCGAWETVVGQVRFFRYVVAENPPPFIYPNGDQVAHNLRTIAKGINLRLPSDTIWTPECTRAKAMRDNLGHMLHFKSIDGTPPEQSVTLLRVPFKDPDEMTIRSGWAFHSRLSVTITAQEAREVLEGLKYVNDCIFSMRKFGMEFAIWPDTRSVESVCRILPWWLDDWGPKPEQPGWAWPTMRQLRIQPKAEFDASLPEGMRPEF